MQTDTPKGYLEPFEGKRTDDLDAEPDVYDSFLRYCARDTFVLRELFLKLIATGRLDRTELSAACGMIRASTDPVLVLDEEIVAGYASQKEAELEQSKQYADDETFANALREHGIEPQTKMGARKELYAFAKTDAFMQDLAEHPSEAVRTLHEGRLMAKSTSERTKARRFADIAGRGKLPPSIMPNGAHTGRDSGGGAINLQNVKRGSPLRRAVMAEHGRTLLVADSSQIECRILNAWAGQDDICELFRAGEDVYLATGARMFGHPITKAEHPDKRQVAKVVELASGYGIGAYGLKKRARADGIDLSEEEAQSFVDVYRESHDDVVALWRRLEVVIDRMTTAPARWQPITVGTLQLHVGKDRLRLPSGRHLVYPLVHYDDERGQYIYGKLSRTKLTEWKLYGGAMAENVTQAMARMRHSRPTCASGPGGSTTGSGWR